MLKLINTHTLYLRQVSHHKIHQSLRTLYECGDVDVYDDVSFTGCPYKPAAGGPELFASKTVPGAVYSCPYGMTFDFLSVPCGCFPPSVEGAAGGAGTGTESGAGTGSGGAAISAGDQALMGIFFHNITLLDCVALMQISRTIVMINNFYLI